MSRPTDIHHTMSLIILPNNGPNAPQPDPVSKAFFNFLYFTDLAQNHFQSTPSDLFMPNTKRKQ
jgi:hypothetical protein